MSVTNPAWNTGVIQPYWFDDSERCLRAGATDMYVLGQGYDFFPGQPLFPGVLLVEAAAQLAGIVSQSDPNLPPLPGLKLTGIRSIKFFGAAIPSDVQNLSAPTSGVALGSAAAAGPPRA